MSKQRQLPHNLMPGDIKLQYNKTSQTAHAVKYYGCLLFINIDNKYAIKYLAYVVVNHFAKSERIAFVTMCVKVIFSFVVKILQ